MATTQEIYEAMLNAEKAGRAEDARLLARALQQRTSKTKVAEAPREPEEPKSFAEETIGNIPESASRYFGGLAEAVMNPIETAKTIGQLGAGALSLGLGDDFQQRLGISDESEQLATQVGELMVERYGSLDAAKETLKNDPVGVLGDLSTVLGVGGVGIAKTAGMASKTARAAGETTSKIGGKIEPLAAVAAPVGAVARIPGEITKQALGVTTGAGDEAISQAFQAGKAGGESASQFRENISGRVDPTDVVDAAKAGVKQIRDNRREAYLTELAKFGKSETPLPIDRMDRVMAEALAANISRGKSGTAPPRIRDPEVQKTLDELNDIVSEYKTLDPLEFHTPIGMDDLKKRIGAFMQRVAKNKGYDSPEYALTKQVYDSIGRELRAHDPIYGRIMKDYAEASDLIRQLETTLSLGGNKLPDTALRKLQSILRNNANTGYGARVKLADQLKEQGGVDVMPALAGQALQQISPRGLSRATAPIGAGVGVATGNIPGLVGALAASSPRLVGEAAFRAGQVAGLPGRAIGAIPGSGLVTSPILRNIYAQTGLLGQGQ